MSKKKESPTVADVLCDPDRYAAELESFRTQAEAMGGFTSPLDRFPEEHRNAVESWPGSALDALTPGDAAIILASQISAGQRAKARKPRPKRKPTVRTETIAAMAAARREGTTLQGFLESAQAGSVDRISLSRLDRRGVERFRIDADAVADGDGTSEASEGTLKDWWTEAGKIAATD